ncbi:MAG: protein phosphatase 2C domain-containing protein, partial [Caldisericia bacterium]|nr:protein phosphatase 2C domain-containing protein [Caldisericia bacterium]
MSKNVEIGIMEGFQYSCITDIGKKRKKNEDAVGFHIPQNSETFNNYGAMFIVADGVGGNSNGEIASKVAVNSILRKYYQTPTNLSIQERLNMAIKTAHTIILEESIQRNTPNMATTVVVAVIFEDIAFFANVGDSRAYIAGPHRVNEIEQITVDHTVVEEQLDRGLISRKEALVAKNKNVITNSLGCSKNVKVDFFKVSLLDGDKILLTTDGLTHVVEDCQIHHILLNNNVESNVKDLVNLANSLGGPDNISLCVLQ